MRLVSRPMAGTKVARQVGARRLELSNLEKPFYEGGVTKGDVIGYYDAIASVMVPHLRNRPMTLKRYPDGALGGFFYEKKCPKYRPDWLETISMRRRDGVEIPYCSLDTKAALVWAANLASLEIHVSLAKGTDLTRPTSMVFDLDPGPGTDILDCAEVGLELKAALGRWDLEVFPKTSGSKGLQLYVPFNTATDYERTSKLALGLAKALEEKQPDSVVTKMSKELRENKIFIDWSQNGAHKTTVCVYSLRAKERPTVSTPVTWKELRTAIKKGDPDALAFTYPEVLKRVDRVGDLFEPVRKLKQKFPKLEEEQ